VLRRYKCKREDIIKIDLKEVEYEDMVWVHVAWD
jgi:hypothetical protein